MFILTNQYKKKFEKRKNQEFTMHEQFGYADAFGLFSMKIF